MGENDNSLWEAVCKTVRKLGDKGKKSYPRLFEISSPHTIDLHNMKVNDAYRYVVNFLEKTSYKKVTIITGRSGIIRKEFPIWMDTLGYSYKNLNEGSFLIKTNRQ